MVAVTRTSQFSGKEATMELPLTQEELDAGLAHSWSHCRALGIQPKEPSMHMQDIFPQLNADQREFLMTGCTPEEWNEMFPPDDEDEDGAR
jgi:hypothetical protein